MLYVSGKRAPNTLLLPFDDADPFNSSQISELGGLAITSPIFVSDFIEQKGIKGNLCLLTCQEIEKQNRFTSMLSTKSPVQPGIGINFSSELVLFHTDVPTKAFRYRGYWSKDGVAQQIFVRGKWMPEL